MSRLYVLDNVADTRKNDGSLNRLFRIIIIILGVIIAVEVLFQLFFVPSVLVRNITVRGNGTIPQDEIVSIAGLGEKEYYFSLNTIEIAKAVGRHPAVRQASCEKMFPDTIVINVVPRTPLAIAIVEDGGRSVPLVFDDEGVVFQTASDSGDFGLPVLSGIDFREFGPGTRLPERLVPFLKGLARMRETSRAVFDFISEVKVEPVSRGDFELVFFTVPYTTRVRTDSAVNESTLVYALMVLDVLRKQKIDRRVREIDFRSNDIVYTDQGGT